MTRRATAALVVLAALLFACGKYGSPVRPEVAAGGGAGTAGVVLDHADTCEDPEHDHGADADPADPPDAEPAP
ncbi:MAG: hypothetical protein ACQGVC_00730 [Myxococcota bacterium]